MSCFVIVGAGQAGAQAADTLRREGFAGRLVIVGDEHALPYQRPPLSKKYLAGEITADRMPFRHEEYYRQHAIELKLGSRARSLLPQQRNLLLESGESIKYDKLLLCLGATARRLTCIGAQLEGIYYLRAINDVPPLHQALKEGARVVIVGGGYIGLETAATARNMGCAVTVLEMADRLMSRVVAPSVSAYFKAEHQKHGVNIMCDTRISHLEGHECVQRVVCRDGSIHKCDVLIVGVGSEPNVDLARTSGLRCNNGIYVDEYCRTSDPDIFAAGDCTSHPSLHFAMRVRLESVDNAVEQAKTAALNMLDRGAVHNRIPWFWSDQFTNKLLIVGLSSGHDQEFIRGNPASGAFSVCYLKGGELLALEAVNQVKDYLAARKLIATRARPLLERLGDPLIALKDI